MVESRKKKVVITGISGYLGSHVCQQFLQSGDYIVRGTVRDKTNAKKIDPLRIAFEELFEQLEIVEADLTNPVSLETAIEGCDYVVHTASPFPIKVPKNDQEIIRPAVDGTIAVMKAAHKHRVQRVVITSSVAAMMMQKNENFKEEYNEEDWSDLTACGPYEKSKTLAEQAAWEFLNQLPDDEKFDLVIINPVLILGPNIVNTDFTSGVVIQKIMSGAFPGMPKVMFPIVDVREVAFAHLQGLRIEEAKNKRFILSGSSLWFKNIAEILKAEYGKDYKFKTGELKYCTMKLASFFDASAKIIMPMWDKKLLLNNQRSRDFLKIEYREASETINQMALSMIECGLIKDKRKIAKPATKK